MTLEIVVALSFIPIYFFFFFFFNVVTIAYGEGKLQVHADGTGCSKTQD